MNLTAQTNVNSMTAQAHEELLLVGPKHAIIIVANRTVQLGTNRVENGLVRNVQLIPPNLCLTSECKTLKKIRKSF